MEGKGMDAGRGQRSRALLNAFNSTPKKKMRGFTSTTVITPALSRSSFILTIPILENRDRL